MIPRFRRVNPAMRSICRAISTTAFAPFSKSRPACAARPRTVIRKSPTPLRAVFSFPSSPVPGSSTSTAALCLAASSVSSRDDGLPTSSSEFTCRTTLRRTGMSSSRRIRIAKTKNTRPAFISSTPGPHNRPRAWRNGMVLSVPSGHTVSECPSARICPCLLRAWQREARTACARPDRSERGRCPSPSR